MRRRRRHPRNDRPSRRLATVGLLAGIVVLGVAIAPVSSFTLVGLDRGVGLDSVSDAKGVIALVVSSAVDIDSTNQLVNVTNNRDESVDVTIALDSSATDVGDLVVDGVDQGDSATFSLAPGGLETVELTVPADCSLGGRSVPFDASAADAGFTFNASRSSSVTPTTGLRTTVALQGQANNHLKMLERDGTLTDFGVTTSGFGPADADFDCDGKMEIPYVDGSNGISIVDVDGETQELVTSGVTLDVVLGVDDYDGNGKPDVLFSNSSDSSKIYRVEYGGSPVLIDGNLKGDSVAGVTDINDDGDEDIVYTDGGKLLYWDGGTEFDTGVSPSTSLSIGAPRDFDGDGVERVPFVSDNNGEVVLVDHNGNTEIVWDGTDTPLGSLGSFDWNDDGTPDVVVVNDADTKLYWIDYTDGSRNGPIQDDGGTDVQGDSYGTA